MKYRVVLIIESDCDPSDILENAQEMIPNLGKGDENDVSVEYLPGD